MKNLKKATIKELLNSTLKQLVRHLQNTNKYVSIVRLAPIRGNLHKPSCFLHLT